MKDVLRLFFDKIENLKWKYIEHICNSDFYRYYRLGRTGLGRYYFKRGIGYHDGLNSIVFEFDPAFSTFLIIKLPYYL